MRRTGTAFWRAVFAGALLAAATVMPAAAQTGPGGGSGADGFQDAGEGEELALPRVGDQPMLWRIDPDRPAPVLPGRDRVRILTGDDYPPFNYISTEGALVGFNVELARALCATLKVTCEIASKPWEELLPALLSGETDAIVASMKITEAALRRVDFSKPYFRTPARFAVRKPAKLSRATPRALSGQRVGVMRGSAHEAYLGAFFSGALIRLYDDPAEARLALKEGRIDALFADGAGLIFWVLGEDAEDCCELVDGAYTEAYFFGDGIGIAVRRGDEPLREAFNRALDRIKLSGTYDQLVRKYLPLDLY